MLDKKCTPTIFMLDKKLKLQCIVLINTYRLTQKRLPRPLVDTYRLIQKKFTTATLTPTNRPKKNVTPTVLMLDSGFYSFDARIKSGSYSFDARIKTLTEMYWSRQYLSIVTVMYWSRQYLTI